MSQLEDLLQTLCPYGVEKFKLSTVSEIKRGQRITKSELIPEGLYPVVSGGINPMGFTNNYNRNENTITVAQYGTAGFVNWQTNKFWANDVCYSIYPDQKLLNRYLYYYLLTTQDFIYTLVIDAVPAHLPQSRLASIEIPIPPLPVQEEIVRILDTFSGVVMELEQNLKAEQAARVSQYEHYRNELLSFDPNSKIMEKHLAQNCLEEVKYERLGGKEGICRVEPSGVDKVINITERSVKLCNYLDVYNNRYITDAIVEQCTEGSVLQNEYERFVLREGQVLLTKDSETREDIAQSAYVCKDFDDVVCGYHLAVLTPVTKINSKYLNYVLQSANLRNYFSKMANGVSRYGLKLKSIEDAIIPVPPLEVQEQVVSILDRFDALVNDLKSGLPAEITLRRKQYEYYRDKLLTFQPLHPL